MEVEARKIRHGSDEGGEWQRRPGFVAAQETEEAEEVLEAEKQRWPGFDEVLGAEGVE